jgi:hypothetical protein
MITSPPRDLTLHGSSIELDLGSIDVGTVESHPERLTQPRYNDPFDMSYAQRQRGRWNPPGSWPTL